MLGLDHNAVYLLWALGITVVVLGGYGLYLRSRLTALRRRAASQSGLGGGRDEQHYSARNVTAAAPMASTAQAASSANGPTSP
jgi:hypothetical protein